MIMKKADQILIASLLALSLLLLVPVFFMNSEGSFAVVKVRNEEIMRLSLDEDGEYTVQGTLGPVHIVVKDGSVAVTQENSPHHYCSKQGAVDNGAVPIVCLPNETVVTIENGAPQEDTVIQ